MGSGPCTIRARRDTKFYGAHRILAIQRRDDIRSEKVQGKAVAHDLTIETQNT